MTLIAGCANASARVGQPSACCCAQTDGAVSSAVVPEGERLTGHRRPDQRIETPQLDRRRRFPEDPPAIMPGEGSLTATVIRWPECSSDIAGAVPVSYTH